MERMDFGCSKTRINLEGDRLSSLSDDLIHKILSFLDITDAIDTSVLSSRWRFIWTSMPYLNFSTEDFTMIPDFSKFVTQVLTRCNNLIDVYSVNLKFRGKATQVFVKRIMNYAFSHNIQQLNVVWLANNHIEFPFCLLSSQSLKHLSFKMQLSRYSSGFAVNRHLTSTWEFPTLTTLELHYVALSDDEADGAGFFSKCVNLKNLTLKKIQTLGSNRLTIIHPRLSNLTLENSCYGVRVVNVVAPQLKNLTIRSCNGEHLISAPDLTSFFYEGYDPLNLSATEGFLSLEKAHICVEMPRDVEAHQIVCLLQQLHSVKHLTLNMEIVEILSSTANLILPQPSPFVNLKSLKIYPENWSKRAAKKAIMSTKLKSYLLDSSPGCTYTLVLREEVQAEYYMAQLRDLLEKEKNNFRTNRAQLDLRVVGRKRKLEKVKPKPGGNIAQIKSYWEDLDAQLHQRKLKVCDIVSKLQEIEELLPMIPESNKTKIQLSYSSLCTEADIVIRQITYSMKILCDKNQSRSSVCFLVPLFQSCSSLNNT